MKIYQIFYDENSKSKLDKRFIPFNNTIPAKPDEFEYGVMRRLYMAPDAFNRNKYMGVMSWKFQDKTKISPAKFIEWIQKNKGYDVYHINPFYANSKNFYNVWTQGEVCHQGLLHVAKGLFRDANLDLELFDIEHKPKVTCYCNYWVATKRFWDLYMSYTEKLYDAVYKADAVTQLRLFAIQADVQIKSAMFSFIFERMFSTVLAKHQDEFKIKPYYT